MPKERAPISTRLRNRDKSGARIPPAQVSLKDNLKREETTILASKQLIAEENIRFSPRVDTNIYMDELQSPLSFVRGSEEERIEFAKEEDEVMSQSFGSNYKSTLSTSTFYQARVSAPVPSKRTRHLHAQTKPPAPPSLKFSLTLSNKRPAISNTLPDVPLAKKRKASSSSSSSSKSPSPSLSSPSSTPTPRRTASSLSIAASKDKKANPPVPKANIPLSPTPSSSIPLSESAKKATKLTPTQLMLAARAAKVKTKAKASSSSSSAKKAKSSSSQEGSTSKKTSTSSLYKTSLYPLAVSDNKMNSIQETPLPLCRNLPVRIKMSPKEKEREYWRRQRRVFIHSRFLSNEEGVQLAKTVYSNLIIDTEHRFVTTMQGNISNFRTRLKKTILSQTKKFNMTIRYLTNTNEAKLNADLKAKIDQSTIKSIWDHWIAEPFVDTQSFYANASKSSFDTLCNVTVQLIIIYFKEQFLIYSQKEARTEIRKLDALTRTMILPDIYEFS